MNDIVMLTFGNYVVMSYEGKKDKVHYYNVKFIDTGNIQLEPRAKVKAGKCKDLLAIKLQHSIEKKVKLKAKTKLSKHNETQYKHFDFKDKNVLALDQASNTGWCIIRNNTVKEYGLIEKTCQDFIENAYYVTCEIYKLIYMNKIDIVIIEAVFSGLNSDILAKLSTLKGMILNIIMRNHCEFEIINANHWKHYHNLGDDRKTQKANSVKKAREILKGKDINDDTADAILIGIYAVKNLGA